MRELRMRDYVVMPSPQPNVRGEARRQSSEEGLRGGRAPITVKSLIQFWSYIAFLLYRPLLSSSVYRR